MDFTEKEIQKIRQNEQEEISFRRNLHSLLNGNRRLASRPLVIGQTTNVLTICGADGNLPLTITKKVIDKCMRPEIRDENGNLIGRTGHGLTESQLLNSLSEIKNPAMVLKSKNNSIVVITTLTDNNNRNIIIPIDLDIQEGRIQVNSIRSIYGRDNFPLFLTKNFDSGNVLAINKEKADKIFQSIGKWYPKEEILISFNDSIAYTTANVNYLEEKNITEIMEDNVKEEFYKVFHAGEQSQAAEDFQKETGWNKVFLTRTQGMTFDSFVVYRSIEDLPHDLQDYARQQESANKRTGSGILAYEVPHREENDTASQDLSKQEQMKQLLKDGIKTVMDSENFANWCEKQSRLYFNHYSFSNAMLTYLQKPDATYVCGYEKWHEYGRQVKKGAVGIKILVPAFAKDGQGSGSLFRSVKSSCVNMLKKNPDLEFATYRLGQSNLNFIMYKNESLWDIKVNDKVVGAHLTEEETKKFINDFIIGKVPVYYNVATVFDISDTTDKEEYLFVAKNTALKSEMVLDENGVPITNRQGKVKIKNSPERIARFSGKLDMKLVEQDPRKMQILYECLQDISQKKDIPILESEKSADATLAGGALGYFQHPTSQFAKGKIVLDQDLSLTNKVAVAFHEMAHSDMHSDLSKLKSDMDLDPNEAISRQMKEMQAEAVAYMTASAFGIETEHKSFNYIANWSSGRELKELEKSLDVIYAESQALLKSIEKELDTRGLTMNFEPKDKTPLTAEQKEPFVKETKSFTLNAMRTNEEFQKDTYRQYKEAELPEEKEILKEQMILADKISKELESVNDMIDRYELSADRMEQTDLQLQINAGTKRVKSMQDKADRLSEQRIDAVQDKAKEDVRQLFISDPFRALKQLQKEVPGMKDLSDVDLKLMAKSEYVRRLYSSLLGKDNNAFAQKALGQLSNMKDVMSKHGCVVEVIYCEQWTEKPIFVNGSVANPKSANAILANAEQEIRGLKAEAEKTNEYFPYIKCGLNLISVGENDKVTSLSQRIDIGDGTQKDLSDVLARYFPKSEITKSFQDSLRERSDPKLREPSWEWKNDQEKESLTSKDIWKTSMSDYRKQLYRLQCLVHEDAPQMQLAEEQRAERPEESAKG